ncbi:MAG: class I SAM-dependent methyltransferase [Verrucomicrobia bacterium]|nr:class I SAM-dependent methyltransferase [Verrucomicrobiota bacterium]
MSVPSVTTTPRLRLRVTAAAEASVRGGHPWVFGDSVREQNREGTLGELAVIYDRRDRFLAIGLYDPSSPLRVRVLHVGQPVALDATWWRERLAVALARRQGMFDAQTTGFRLVNGESDGWPGLVLDRYGSVGVLKLYTGAWLPRLPHLVPLIPASTGLEAVVLRLSRNIQAVARADFGLQDGQVISGSDVANPVEFLESGLRFEADVVRGQKTGFFLDQRENRRRVGDLAAGRRVLNAFSFSGGFSLYAARGRAISVTDLDISPHALAAARRNFALNHTTPSVARCQHETVQADAFDWLAAQRRPAYDLVVLDPPSLARREAEREGALRAYGRLARDGIRVLRQGGRLVAASCSAHVSAEEFFAAVRRAGRESGRRFSEMATTRHPPDHPATFPEAQYLKAIFLVFEP